MAQSKEYAVSAARLQQEVDDLRHELKTVAVGHPPSLERITVGDYLLRRLVQLGVTVGVLY